MYKNLQKPKIMEERENKRKHTRYYTNFITISKIIGIITAYLPIIGLMNMEVIVKVEFRTTQMFPK